MSIISILVCIILLNEELEVIKGVIKIRKLKKDRQRSTKYTHTTKDRISRTTIGDEFRCLGKVGSSCSTSGTRRVNLDTNPVISHE